MCLDDPDFAKELVEENGWERMVHAGMDAETKEVAKETWGFKAVPYLVVIGTARHCQARGKRCGSRCWDWASRRLDVPFGQPDVHHTSLVLL